MIVVSTTKLLFLICICTRIHRTHTCTTHIYNDEIDSFLIFWQVLHLIVMFITWKCTRNALVTCSFVILFWLYDWHNISRGDNYISFLFYKLSPYVLCYFFRKWNTKNIDGIIKRAWLVSFDTRTSIIKKKQSSYIKALWKDFRTIRKMENNFEERKRILDNIIIFWTYLLIG